jgi:hypothetical protein
MHFHLSLVVVGSSTVQSPVSTPSGHDRLISALPSDVLTVDDVLWPAATPLPPENLALVVLDEEASSRDPCAGERQEFLNMH